MVAQDLEYVLLLYVSSNSEEPDEKKFFNIVCQICYFLPITAKVYTPSRRQMTILLKVRCSGQMSRFHASISFHFLSHGIYARLILTHERISGSTKINDTFLSFMLVAMMPASHHRLTRRSAITRAWERHRRNPRRASPTRDKRTIQPHQAFFLDCLSSLYALFQDLKESRL